MNKKLWFLTKKSIDKKIKTKWFLIANIIFLILIVGIVNIDRIIKAFGGDFSEDANILVIDNANVFNEFKDNYLMANKYISDYEETEILLYDKSYDDGISEVEEDKHKILLVIDRDEDNYINAKVVSKNGLGTITSTILNSALTNVRSELALLKYNITKDEFADISVPVNLEKVVLSDENKEDDMVISTVMQVITFPIFMLIIFLIQMIGAEVNEEKTTKSMEIIISNVSPRTHFLSKIIASNAFVLIQSLLLISFAGIALLIRFIINGGDILSGLDSDILNITNMIPIDSILSTLSIIIPILIIMMFLTFLAYSLLAGILASMTTNIEDYQQMQTPLVVVTLAGYYLSIMAGLFKGSLFIKIMSYIPFISALLAPTLYVMGDITIVDLIISILLIIGIIYIFIKYGLKIYKVGILNYSGNDLWKKMFKAIKEK